MSSRLLWATALVLAASACHRPIDASAPTVSIDEPPSGVPLSGVVDLRGSAQGPATLTQVELTIDEGAPQLAAGTQAWSFALDTRSLPNGSHGLSVVVTDEQRHTGAAALTFEVLNGPADPTLAISIVSPTAGARVVGNLTASGTSYDPHGSSAVSVRIDDGLFEPALGSESWTFSFDTRTLSNGPHRLTARVTSAAGASADASLTVDVENSASDLIDPVVTLQSPAPDSTGSGVLNVSGTASDNVALDHLAVQLDDGAPALATGTDHWTFALDTRPFSNGTHSITATATDTAGNTGAATISINLDNPVADGAPPRVAFTRPATGATVSGAVDVGGTASDDVAVARVELKVDNGALQTVDGTGPWTFLWNSSGASNGVHVLTARATDTSGKTSQATLSVTLNNPVDPTNPTLSISAPTAGATVSGVMTASGVAADNVAVAAVHLSLDAGPFLLASGTTSWSQTFDTSSLLNGPHTLIARATDTSGRLGTASVTFTVNNQAPSCPLTHAPFPAAVPTVSTIFNTLRAGHPRLLLTDVDLACLTQRLSADPTLRAYRDSLVAQGTALLPKPPQPRVVASGNILTAANNFQERVFILSLLYRLDGNVKWAARAKAELLSGAAWSDWNPIHFLDTAQMSLGVGIGYDWLYGYLTVAERTTLRTALIDKGLTPAQVAYGHNPPPFWVTSDSNWNAVCNGGLIIGALAIADESVGLASGIVVNGINALKNAGLTTYLPDGGYEEGPSYWGFGTEHVADALSGLETALNRDFGLAAAPGLSGTGLFKIQAIGPTNRLFNFADSAYETIQDEPALFYLGRRFNVPLYAWGARNAAAGEATFRGLSAFSSVRDFIWYDSRPLPATGLPALDAQFARTHIAMLRSSWTAADAAYVGFKGGDNAAGHAHLDLGTFVYDVLGQRWAIALGKDNYTLPGYFNRSGPRWTYYRTATRGQNTLLLDDLNQDPSAKAPLIDSQSTADFGYEVADLTAGYAPAGATRVQRGVALLTGRQRLLVSDEFQTSRPVTVVWGMHTRATVSISASDPRQATLTLGGKTVRARILIPANAVFEVAPVVLSAAEKPTTGVSKLTVRLPAPVGAGRLAVSLSPSTVSGELSTVNALADWGTAGPGN